MKFANDHDAKLFCLEIDRSDLLLESDEAVSKDFKPCEDMIELFLKKRRELVPHLKNFRRRQNTKKQWRHDRYKMMRGIKRFHKSTAGKRFHRSLGRFLATRECLKKSVEFTVSLHEVADVLKALSSLKTHAFVELEFYHPMAEEVEYLTFIEELIPTVGRIEKEILSGNFFLEEDDEDFMLRVVKEESIIYALEQRSEYSFDEIKEKWRTILDSEMDERKADSIDELNLSKALTKLKSDTLETPKPEE